MRDFVSESELDVAQPKTVSRDASSIPTVNLLDGDPVLRDLIAARALIARRETWCQRAGHLNVTGDRVSHLNGDAVAHCSWGALRVVTQAVDMLNNPAFRHLQKFCGNNVIAFNDSHTHEEVLAAWDSAIAARKAAQP